MPTSRGRRFFFATQADLAPGLHGVEQANSIQYVLQEMRDDKAFTVLHTLSSDAGLGLTMGNQVLRQVGVMTFTGAVIGIAGAIALGRGAQSMLYELKGWDPMVIALSAVALTLVALGAALVTALRASRVDPMQALRHE